MSNKTKEEPSLEPEAKKDEKGEDQFPTDTAVLTDDLKAFGVRAPARVATYLAQGNLEDAFWLDRALSDMNVDVNSKKPFIKFWLNKKGSAIPEELETKLSPEVRKKEEVRKEKDETAKAKYSVDEESGVIKVASTSEKALTWEEAEKLSKNIKKETADKGRGGPVLYVFDTETEKVRMAKEGEMGGTLEQAKQLKQMAEKDKEAGGESPFIMDGEGNWMLNPKARITGVEFMAMQQIKRAQEKGESVDPLAKLGEAAETIKTYREIFGGGGGDTPAWMRDPVQLIKTVQSLTPKSEAGDVVVKELDELKKALVDMKEQRNREQLETQQNQIRLLADRMKELTDKVVEVRSLAGGKSEMDILSDITKEGLGLAKEELPALRKDLREAIGTSGLPGPKTPEQRAARKAGFTKAIQKDKAIESLGKRLFFSKD